VLAKVGARDVADVVGRAGRAKVSEQMKKFLARRSVDAMLGGMSGRPVEITYLDESDAPHAVTIVREDAKGTPITFGELPTFLARVESRKLAGGVGYLAFNVFLPPLMDDIREAMRSFKDAPAIVIDLRGNPGGVGGMAPAVASLLLSETTSLGTMKMRTGEIRFVTYKQPSWYSGPVVFLTDEGSASTSEILAGTMQEMGRATVIGEPSLGAVLPSMVQKLPNGAVFQYAVADFKTPKGVLLEGRGVTPDVLVTPTRADYLAGRDPVLDAALKYLESRTRRHESRLRMVGR
jgi:carboxyl-terminal processing protease